MLNGTVTQASRRDSRYDRGVGLPYVHIYATCAYSRTDNAAPIRPTDEHGACPLTKVLVVLRPQVARRDLMHLEQTQRQHGRECGRRERVLRTVEPAMVNPAKY